MKTNKEMLIAAKELLIRDGWRKGSFGPTSSDERGTRCASGALQAVLDEAGVGHPGTFRNVLWGLQKLILEGKCMGILSEWNDLPSTTFEDVIAAFDRAIEKEDFELGEDAE